MLLGNDFNRKAGVVINCLNNSVQFLNKSSTSNEYKAILPISDINSENLHAYRDMVLEPKRTSYVKVSVSHKKKNYRTVGVVHTNNEIFSNQGLFIKETEMNFENGTGVMPLQRF